MIEYFAEGALRGFFVATEVQMVLAILLDVDRAQLRAEGMKIAESEELRTFATRSCVC